MEVKETRVTMNDSCMHEIIGIRLNRMNEKRVQTTPESQTKIALLPTPVFTFSIAKLEYETHGCFEKTTRIIIKEKKTDDKFQIKEIEEKENGIWGCDSKTNKKCYSR